MRPIFRLVGAGLLIWAAGFASILAVQFFWPRNGEPPAAADAVICLGAGMSRQGWYLPDAASTRRALSCAALYRAGAAPVVVFTGAGHEVYSVAEAMADIARDEGLPEDAILMEPHARSTLQNADFARAMLPAGAGRVILVSDAYHLPRSWVVFRAMGYDDVALYPAMPGEEPDASDRTVLQLSLRESLAIWFNLARLAAYGAGGLAGVDHDTRIGWFN